MVVCCSGRGDKDVDTAAAFFGLVTDEEIVESAVASVTDPESAGEGW
jgi:tryptophan synthase beta chain